jgi:dsDNA-specific endonuclease/ATPase MutS2
VQICIFGSFTDIMAWKNGVMRELEVLSEKMCNKEYELNIEVYRIEEEIKARNSEKKEILLKEMKKVLVKLNNIEGKVVKDLKVDAFALLHVARNLSDEVSTFKDAVENASDFNRSWKSEFLRLKDNVDFLKTDLVSCMNISVQVEQGLMHTGFDQVLQSISLETPALKSKKTLTNDLLKCDKFNILDKMYETVLDEETEYVSNYVMQCFKF